MPEHVRVQHVGIGTPQTVQRSHVLRRQVEAENIQVLCLTHRVRRLGAGDEALLYLPIQQHLSEDEEEELLVRLIDDFLSMKGV
ncbi:MAG TPA: hypothetical protein VFW68_09420 [Rhodocyclaceae bacterium]|nr:hypothetical protein [Rhodocyclaceae bacterium]